MSRRDPLFEAIETVYLPAATGYMLVAPEANTHLEIKSIIVSPVGVAGEATFYEGLSAFTSISVDAYGAQQVDFNTELAKGSGLYFTATTPLDITLLYVAHSQLAITKEAARAATYNAWKAQKAAGLHAVRTPNKFGGQVEG